MNQKNKAIITLVVIAVGVLFFQLKDRGYRRGIYGECQVCDFTKTYRTYSNSVSIRETKVCPEDGTKVHYVACGVKIENFKKVHNIQEVH